MRNILVIILFILIANKISAQSINSKEVEEKIKLFENSFPIYYFQPTNDSIPDLNNRMKNYNINGLSIAVINNYKIDWAKGYGWADVLDQRKVTTETPFQVGSVSKSLNALGIMKLAQEHKLDINADINNYLTSWKFPYDKLTGGKIITTTNLLNHTAGLSIHGLPGYSNTELMPSIIQILNGSHPAKNKPVRSVFKPGEKFEYSGGGTTISQLIVSDITHDVYTTYMESNVFKALELSNSYYNPDTNFEKLASQATGYLENGSELKGKYYRYSEAAGGLWSTPTDICKFIIEMQLSLQNRSNKILSQGATNLMLTPFNGTESALGVFIEKKGSATYFQHSGGSIGFRCKYYGSITGGYGVVVMVNSSNGAIIEEVINNIARIYNWNGFNPDFIRNVKRETVTFPDSVLDNHIGAYRSGNEIIKIIKINNSLYYQGFQGGGNNMWEIYFTSNKDFFNRESRSEKSFYFDKKGNVKGFKKHMNGKSIGKYEKVSLVNIKEPLLTKHTGKYDMWGVVTEVYKKDGKLWMKITDGYEMEMNFISPNEFFLLGEEIYNTIFRFYYDSNGDVDGIIEKNENSEKAYRKIKSI